MTTAADILDPQMRAVFDQLKELSRGLPDRWSVPVAEARRMMLEGRRHWTRNPPELHAIADRTIAGPFRAVPIRVYRPRAARDLPGLIYFHGGGWALGSVDTHDLLMRRLALAADMAVIGIDYAKAPEFRFPRPVEEAAAAIRSVAAHARFWGLDPGRLAFGGDSAGANVALAAAQAVKSATPGLLKAGILFYGVFDTDFATESYVRFGGGEFGLAGRDMEKFLALYLERDAQRNDPRIALVRSDLRGLPPLGLYAAGVDPLRDDSAKLARALATAGIAHEHLVYDGLCHSFLHYPDHIDRAGAAIARAAAFLAAAFLAKV
jgi:acetyl esterase